MIPNPIIIRDQYTGMVNVGGECVFGGGFYSVNVRPAQWADYMGGMKAQDAFPDLTANDREFLISGISPTGWAMAFPDDK